MDCNAPPNFDNFIKNVPQMGIQNQIPNKDMHPCFEIPIAPPGYSKLILEKELVESGCISC